MNADPPPRPAPARSRRFAIPIALASLAIAALFREDVIARVHSPDGRIGSSATLWAIRAHQAAWAAFGLWLLVSGGGRRLRGLPLAIAALVAFVGVAYGTKMQLVERRIDRASAEQESWRSMIAAEEQIQHLMTLLPDFDESVLDLGLPTPTARKHFADRVAVRDLAPGGARRAEHAADDLVRADETWAVADALREVDAGSLRLWQPFLDDIEYFDHAHFYIPFGDYVDGDRTRFECTLGFGAVGRRVDGSHVDVHASQTVTWSEVEGEWRVAAWDVDHFELAETPAPLFRDVAVTSIRDPRDAARAREAIFDDLIADLIESGEFLDIALSELPGGDTHPGLSVVDFDRDGLDDLYVIPGWGKNMLLHNLGDGTFEDVAASVGLDVEDDSNASIFADFDNDGDSDLFLARSYERSRLYDNENGRFVDRSATHVDRPLPYLVSSVSAADHDLDGLLDLYASTNGAGVISNEIALGTADDNGYLDQYVSPEDALHMAELVASPDFNRVLNLTGPPNELIQNVGNGRFELGHHPEVRVFRNTFQATWADYDVDGDPDLYVANDWSVNALFENEPGRPFVDVALDTGTTDVGFGMGASWGDFDQDGRQDLYVSNMFSKAGRRILGNFGHVDDRLNNTHRGNTLFRNGGERFDKVSGIAEPSMLVEAAGWSWGSQFADLDNDTWLDIYALSGNFTAPERVEAAADI